MWGCCKGVAWPLFEVAWAALLPVIMCQSVSGSMIAQVCEDSQQVQQLRGPKQCLLMQQPCDWHSFKAHPPHPEIISCVIPTAGDWSCSKRHCFLPFPPIFNLPGETWLGLFYSVILRVFSSPPSSRMTCTASILPWTPPELLAVLLQEQPALFC